LTRFAGIFIGGRKVISISSILLSLCLSGFSQSVLNLSPQPEKYAVGRSLLFYEDKSASLPDSMVLSGSYDHRFAPPARDVLNFGVTNSAVWVKFKLKNMSPDKNPEWILVVKNALLDSLWLFTAEDGKWKKEIAGDHLPFAMRPIQDHDFSFYLSLPDTSTRTYYMRFITTGSMQIPVEIHTKSHYQGAVQLSELLYGLFSGALLIMFLYNLVVFFSLRDYSYLAYSIFILTNLALMNSYSGHLFQYIFPNQVFAANRAIPVLMAFTPFSVGLFSLLYLHPKEIAPFLRWVLYITCGISLVLVALVFVLPFRLGTSLAGLLIIVVLLAAIAAGISSWARGNQGARFYVIAWILLIVSGLITAFRNFGFLEYNFFTVQGTRIATLIEVALLSLSLADRYNRFRKEKEQAQLELIETQQRANRELEQKVKERTRQLSETNDKLNETLHEVEAEREKSDALLLNVLPKEVMLELKETGQTVPRNFEMATVLFTDIQNFTRFAEALTPEELIKSLNECFQAFDDICRKYNLEKIKTLGDGYMAVGGVPVANRTNPTDVVKAGLDMQAWIRRRNQQANISQEKAWEIRIGINTGPLVAGVIGKHKFVYDIWGDTVNLASRMESSGEVGQVNISSFTYEYIKDKFVCHYKGKVLAKNKGEVDLFQVIKPI
jgi:class 3 adenylate cyclase